MEPQYNYNQRANDSVKKTVLRLLVGGVLVVVLVIIVNLITSHIPKTQKIGDKTYTTNSSQASGSVKLTLTTLPDYSGLSVSLNQEALTDGSLSTSGTVTKQLPAGNYDLNITKPGYKSFSAQFSVVSGHATIVNADLQPNSTVNITSWGQLHVSGDPIQQFDTPTFLRTTTPNFSIVSVQYFYNKTWAVVVFNDGSQDGYEVAQYNLTNDQWNGVVGTSQFIPTSDLSQLPTQVQNYLENNNNAYTGGNNE